MGSNDQTGQIVKGKRTKRQRSSSPFGLAMTDSSSSGCGGGGGGGAGGERESVMDDYNSISSPTTSGEIYESTEEEEDMANCLIMLARGDAPRQLIQENPRGDEDAKIEKLGTSRKFSTIVTTTNKAGFFVYECKTCNRSFPSFQALGGHRASHKKPKAAVEEKKPSLVVPVKEDFEQETGNQFNKTISSSPVSLQVTATAANNKGNKVHECSICGSEFTSGQALGGHMRRHRAAAAAAVHVTTGNRQVGTAISADTSTTNESNSGDDHHHHQVKTRSILPLDLNLPAPEDDHHQLRSDSKFQFGSTQQALVFSAPALVDCHY